MRYLSSFRKICKFILDNILVHLLHFSRPKYDKKYCIVICGIFKNEASFLKEWIEYHHMVGIDHFYLYNNYSDDNYQEVLQPYLDCGWVTLIDWPYNQAQMKAYRHYYETYRHDTQWVSFLDIDEFIVPKDVDTIGEWLKASGFEKYPAVLIYWRMFGTSGKTKLEHDKLVIEQFVNSWPKDYLCGKCLVNTDYDICLFDASTHHAPLMRVTIGQFSLGLRPINNYGLVASSGIHRDKLLFSRTSDIQINHYWSKSWDVYNRKRQMSDVFFTQNPKEDINYFLFHEMKNTDCDYTIFRFIIKLKIIMGLIKL